MKVIDVSHWQGNIDFNAVKSAGISGVIVKAGGSDAGFYTDSTFEKNYNNAVNAGLNVGSYYFVGAKCLSEADGKADAKRFIEIIKGKKFDLPVYMDVEAQAPNQRDAVSNAIIGFCGEMENNGYFTGVYASDLSGFKDRINLNTIKGKYSLWVARYGSEPTYAIPYDMWQYTSTNRVKGISGNVDTNECYKDFPSIIKNAGLNGYGKGTPVAPTPAPEVPKPTEPTNNAPDVYIVKAGDTLSGIAAKYGTTYQVLAEYNGIADPNKIYAGQTIKIPNGSKNTVQNTETKYVVKAGDNLTKISKMFNTTISKIAKDNGIADPNKIYVGQVLIIK